MPEVAEWEMVFEGNDGRECEQFVLGVRKQALARGLQKDDEWVAQFAAAHIGGEALRWYESLDEDTQDSWKLLRRALLAKYSREASQALDSAFIPTPAAAAPPRRRSPSPVGGLSLASLAISTTTTPNDSLRRGRIQVKFEGGTFYVSKKLRPNKGFFAASSSPSDAVIVRLEKDGDGACYRLALEDHQWPHLGVSWTTPNPVLDVNSTTLARLCGVSMTRSAMSTSYHLKGLTRTSVWEIAGDGTLSVNWAGTDKALSFGLSTMNENALLISPNIETLLGVKLVRLVFEDIHS